MGSIMDAKGLLATASDYSCFLDAYGFIRRKFIKSQIAVLMYHRISPKLDTWSLGPLSPQSFEKQIKYLSRNYNILSLDRLVEYIEQGRNIPEKAVVITFDDGYKDNYRYAYPILKKYHAPATIFLTTGHIGTGIIFWWDKVGYIIQHTNLGQLCLDQLGCYSLQSDLEKSHAEIMIKEKLKNLPEEKKDLLIEELLAVSGVDIPTNLSKEYILSWDEVREMSNDGIQFGAHTVSHPILTNIPLEQARSEIIQSKVDIEKTIGQNVTTFAYPNGNFNADIVELVKKNGFLCAVAVSPSKLISSKDSIYALGRIGADENFSKSKVMLCGLWEDLKAVLYSEISY